MIGPIGIPKLPWSLKHAIYQLTTPPIIGYLIVPMIRPGLEKYRDPTRTAIDERLAASSLGRKSLQATERCL